MKEERAKLFKSGQPHFRFMTLEDLQWLWAAYKMTSDQEMGQEEFKEWVSSHLEDYARVYIVEDENHKFAEKRGPIGFFATYYDGWNIEPHVEFFPWATAKNKVKSIVGFLMYQRFQPDIGCIRIHSSDENRNLFKRLSKYVPIRVGGKIAGGRPDGADHIFYVRGKKHG